MPTTEKAEVSEMAEDIKDRADSNGHSDDRSSVRDALMSKELLVPAALSAVGAVAATKGPDIVRKLTETAEEKSAAQAERMGERAMEGAKSGLSEKGGVLGKVASKALPGGGGDGGGGGGKKTRRLPIQRWTDVAVSIDKAYGEWTNFNEFPKFMHRVLNVRREDDKVRWDEKIWFSKRQWEGRITDRRKNDRIAWKTTSGTQHHGVVTFHKLDENLTRVMVDMEFEPTGMIEKMASGMRFVKRAVEADLARFKAHCEMKDAKGIEYKVTRDEDDQKSKEREQKSDDERDSGRRERESRRQERRQASGAKS
jgi:hypothetical protein